jgi:hypothetical protein
MRENHPLAKHAIRQFILARLVLGSAATILLALVVWVAVVAGGSGGSGDPLLVQPTADLQAAAGSLPAAAPSAESATVTPSVTPSAGAAGSASPSPSAPASASASPSVKPRPSKSASRTPSASPSRAASPTPTPDVFAATYSTSANWRDGFIAAVRIVNNGSTARDWSVTLTYPSSAGIEVRGAWNATAGVSGNTVTLRGKSLAGGGSITVGFQGTKDIGDAVKPVTCSVSGGSCRMS